MKLKDFIFSTLPRSRKSKRKQSKSSTTETPSPETSDVTTRDNKHHSDVINGNSKKKKNKKPDLACSAPAQNGYLTGISHNKNLVSSDFQYFTENSHYPYVNPYGHQTLAKTPSNTSESGFEDYHDQFYGQYESYPQNFQPYEDVTLRPDLLSNSFNTFPRERTRIKTNPWVSKHANTMTSSLHGQVNDNTQYRSPYSVSLTSSRVASCYHDYNINGNSSATSDGSLRTSSRTSSSNSSVAPDSSVPPSPVTGHVTYRDSAARNYDDSLDCKQDGVLEGGDLVINLNTGDIFVKPKPDFVSSKPVFGKPKSTFVKPKPVFAPVNFQYEEDLDATLERDNGRRKTRSRRRRDEDKCYYLTQEDLATTMDGLSRDSDDDGDEFVMRLGDGTSFDDSDNDADRESTLTRDGGAQQWSYQTSNNQSFRKRGLKQRKYRMDAVLCANADASCKYSPYKTMYYGNDNSGDSQLQQCHADAEIMVTSQPREMTDSAYDSSTLSSVTGSSHQGATHGSDTPDPSARHRHRPTTLPGVKHRKHKNHKADTEHRRSLEEIHYSLKEKVDRLRVEKRVVDEKIQQAREEERLRREEKERIEQEVTSLRKQVLLQTLQDLKDNLHDQSHRLQEAYDDVLDMQWLNARLRRLRNTTL